MAITVHAIVDSRGAQIGALQFNAALASMRNQVGSTRTSITGLASSLFSLRGILTTVVAGLSGAKIASIADDFLLLKSRLGLVASEGTSTTNLLDGIADAATRARTPVLELTKLYQRNANALTDLGRSEAEGIRLAETLAKVTAVSGVSAGEASAAMRQLSQSIVSNRLQGDEFRSIAENLPEVLRVLQRETGKTAKELRKLSEEGALTGEILVNSLLNASKDIDDKFAKVPVTAGAAFSMLTDQMARTFGLVAENSGVSKALADVLNKIRETIASPEMHAGFKIVTDGIVSLARGYSALIDVVKEAKIQIEAWHKAISETALYKTFAAAVTGIKDAFTAVWGAVRDTTAAAFAGGESIVDPKLAENAKLYADQLREVAKWQVTVSEGNGKITAADTSGKKLPVQFGADEDTIRRIKRMIELDDLRNQKAEALLNNDQLIADALETEIELRAKITDELRKAPPELVAQLRQQVLISNEIERQKKIQDANKRVGEEFASTMFAAFRDAGEQGMSFTKTLALVGKRMADLFIQTAILEPMIKKLGQAFATSMGGSDFSKLFTSLIPGLGGSGDVGLGSWTPSLGFASGGVFSGPIRFSAPGMQNGQMAEAGPEAIMPLKRDASGRLGVSMAGGQQSSPNVHITVTGDATDATIEKMRRVARDEFSRGAPGIVKASVQEVGREHRRDNSFLRR